MLAGAQSVLKKMVVVTSNSTSIGQIGERMLQRGNNWCPQANSPADVNMTVLSNLFTIIYLSEKAMNIRNAQPKKNTSPTGLMHQPGYPAKPVKPFSFGSNLLKFTTYIGFQKASHGSPSTHRSYLFASKFWRFKTI